MEAHDELVTETIATIFNAKNEQYSESGEQQFARSEESEGKSFEILQHSGQCAWV